MLIAAMTCFLSGVAVGLLVPELAQASSGGSWDADEDYVSRLQDDLGLSSAQVETLRMILVSRQEEEIRLIKASALSGELPEGLKRLLDANGVKADRRIQEILDDKQKELFQELRDKMESDRWPRP
jgi:hypothetical protein